MVALGERFAQWIGERAAAWKNPLAVWAESILDWGTRRFFDHIAARAAAQLKPFLDKVEAMGGVLPELQPLFDELRNPTGELAGINAANLAGRLQGGAVGKIMDALLIDAAYKLNYFVTGANPVAKGLRPSDQDMIQLYIRNYWSADKLVDQMRIHGYLEDTTRQLKDLWRVILPTEVVIPVWLRDRKRWNLEYTDLTHLGLSAHQIEMLTEAAYKMPSPQDVVTWLGREVFEPDQIARYGLDDEWGGLDKSLFDKIGLKEEYALNYWRAHWQHASWTQVTEMLHRGLMTEEQVWEWFRLVEIPPYWREKLIRTAYQPYTRVDSRRMWDVGAISDEELYRNYKDLGYDHEHAVRLSLWTKIYTRLPQIVARYKNGYISLGAVFDELVALGVSEAQAQYLIEVKVKAEGGDRLKAEKDLTAAQIFKGVRKGKITRAQAVVLLQELGYDQAEAILLLDIEAPADETDGAVRTRELTKADILAGLKAGTLTTAVAYAKLIGLRYLPADAEYILQVYQDSIKPPEPARAKEITRADVINAVTRGLVTAEMGLQLLRELRYSDAAARFILALIPEEDTPEVVARRQELGKSDILAGLKTGELGEDEALRRLQELRYSADEAAYIYNVFLASVLPVKARPQREVVKASVVLAVRRGLVTPEQAFTLLIDAGYTDAQAEFALGLKPESSPFSPVSFDEYRELTARYRGAVGSRGDRLPPEAVELNVREAQAAIEGRSTVNEQTRIQIDTIRRNRRKGVISRDEEVRQLRAIKVPDDYAAALVANDDARLAKPAA